MAIRAQFLGAKVKMAQVPLFTCDHMPGGTGDHMPIFICQHQHDEPLLHQKFRDPDWTTNINFSLVSRKLEESPRRLAEEI